MFAGHWWIQPRRRFVPAYKLIEFEKSLNWDYTDRTIYRKYPMRGWGFMNVITNWHGEIKSVNEDMKPKKKSKGKYVKMRIPY